MANAAHLLDNALSPRDIHLGWMVVSRDNPREDVLKIRNEPIALIKQHFAHLSELKPDNDARDFLGYMEFLLSCEFKLKEGVSVDLSGATCDVERILDPDRWFKKTCGREDVRKWLTEHYQKTGGANVKIWLVVGVDIIRGVKLRANTKKGFVLPKYVSTEVCPPETLGDAEVLSKFLDYWAADVEGEIAFHVKDVIYAVQYRQLNFKLYADDILPPILGDNTIWEIMGVNAGSGEGQFEELRVSLEKATVDESKPAGVLVLEDPNSHQKMALDEDYDGLVNNGC